MEATTKLQKAGREFLLRLVVEFGPRGAARMQRALGYEVDVLSVDDDVVHVVLWTADGPMVMAIGERLLRARRH